MSTDSMLVEAYLSNIQYALQHLDVPCAESLVAHTLELLAQSGKEQPFERTMRLGLGVGLHPGIQRKGTPNQDFVFATTGYTTHKHEAYGLFVVADGMGGHARGQIASRLATQTLVDALLPSVQRDDVKGAALGKALVDAVHQANTIIYEQNQHISRARSLDRMGTTVTTALVVGPHAFIANVGDSRTYLYRAPGGLRAITRDHSVVATLVASGMLTPDEVYTHPDRNKILRCLGAAPGIEVDLFYEPLHNDDLLLCCSDGVWETARDQAIARILSSSWFSAEQMAACLTQAALQGGGVDNIGLTVAHVQMNVTAMQTVVDASSPSAATAS